MMPEVGQEKLADFEARYPAGTATTHELTDAVAQRPGDSA